MSLADEREFARYNPQPFVVHPAEWKCWEHYFETGVWDEGLRLTFDQASMSWVLIHPLLWEGDNA